MDNEDRGLSCDHLRMGDTTLRHRRAVLHREPGYLTVSYIANWKNAENGLFRYGLSVQSMAASTRSDRLLQPKTEPEVRRILIVRTMPLEHLDHRRNVDWHWEEFDRQRLCVLARQSRRDRRDSLGADDHLRDEIETGRHH